MADIAAEKQNLEAFFSSIGVAVNAGDDADLRLKSVAFLHQMTQIFGDDAAKKIKVEDYTPEIVAGLKKGIQTKIADETIELDKLQAIVDHDVDVLAHKYLDVGVGSFNPRVMAKKQINAIYAKHQTHPEKAYREILAKSDDEKTQDFIKDIEHHAPHFIDNLPATVAFLKNPDSVFKNLEAFHTQTTFAKEIDPAKLTALDPAKQRTDAVTWVEKRIGIEKPDGKWGAAEQVKLKAYTMALQENAYFGKGLNEAEREALPDNLRALMLYDNEQDGLYDFDFAVHLNYRVEAMPEGTQAEKTDKEDYRLFIKMMDKLEKNGSIELISKADRMNIVDATATVKNGLSPLIGLLNDSLKKAKAKSGDNVLVKLLAGDILNKHIPPIEKLDGKFNFQDQTSLQGLMMVLTPLLSLKGKQGEEWLYTPEKGAQIKAKLRDTKNPPMFLNFIDKDARKNLMEMVKGDGLDEVIESLDYMHAQKQIASYQIYHGEKIRFATLTKTLLQDEVKRLNEAENPDAIKLLDTLMYKYTNIFGINSVLDDDIKMDIDATVSLDARLKDFYKKARTQFDKDPKGYDDFTAFLLPMLDTVQVLPFGYKEQRSAFKAGVLGAIKGAEGDADQFVKGVNGALKSMAEKHGSVNYTSWNQVSPVLHPKLATFKDMTSGGKNFTVDDVVDAYNDFHLGRASGDDRKYGRSMPLITHTYVSFKDDDGVVRVAAVDRNSMIFTVERVNLDVMKPYLYPEKFNADDIEATSGKSFAELQAMSLSDRVSLLEKVDPASALVYQNHEQHSSLVTSFKGFYDSMSGSGRAPVPSLSEIVRENAQMAQRVHDNAQEIHDKPLIAKGTASDSHRSALQTEHKRAVARAALPSVSNQDRQDLTQYVYSLSGHRPMAISAAQLALLQRVGNRDDLTIGSGLGQPFRLRGVSIGDNPEGRAMMASYDRDSKMVIVTPAPDHARHKSTSPAHISEPFDGAAEKPEASEPSLLQKIFGLGQTEEDLSIPKTQPTDTQKLPVKPQ